MRPPLRRRPPDAPRAKTRERGDVSTGRESMITVQNVTKVYPQGSRMVHALRGVSLCIRPGEFVSIMGPSGSGKSTLLHLLGALDVPTTGAIHFAGHDLKTLSE